MKPNPEEKCPLCKRPLGSVNIDRHHLVPAMHGGKETEWLHKSCHRKIHSVFTEKELEKKFNTVEKLLTNEEIQKFTVWVQKKPSDFYDGSVETNVRHGKRWKGKK